MNKYGPIIVVDDDKEDQDILKEIFAKLDFRNEIIFFEDGDELIDYINTPASNPFLILSDVNLPKVDGIELRNKVFELGKSSSKFVPFLFFTTGTYDKVLLDAYSLPVQGFFIKPNNLASLEGTIKNIIAYWKDCVGPY